MQRNTETYALTVRAAENHYRADIAKTGDYPSYANGVVNKWPYLHVRFGALAFRAHNRLGYLLPTASFTNFAVTDDFGNLAPSSLSQLIHFSRQHHD